MKLKPKEIRLPSGRDCILKSPHPSDAAAILQLMKATSGETAYLARYEDEIHLTVDSERQFLENQLFSQEDLMVCAVMDGQIVANAGISPSAPYEKYRHRGTLGISILCSHWGLGIGSALLEEIISCVGDMGYEQLELEVVCDNERAVALYQKFGFEIYGRRTHSFKYRDGSYGDEYLMLRPLYTNVMEGSSE